jgi:micrococcal nuclease
LKRQLLFALPLLLAGCIPEAAEHGPEVITTIDSSNGQDPTSEAGTDVETDADKAGGPAIVEEAGEVIAVLSGDMIDIQTNANTTTRIRFNGIDAPEEGQPFGDAAKQFLSQTIGGKVVRIVRQGVDQEGRVIADVYLAADVAYAGSNPAGVILPDKFLNRELVQRGLAWHDKQYSDDQRLAEDETRARAAKLGLWSDPRHVAPWEWRKLSKEERDKLR